MNKKIHGRKRNPVAEFSDDDWMCEFAFIVGITTHLTELNTRLQRTLQLIDAMLDHVTSFEIKSRLWEPQMKSTISCNFQLCRSVISGLSLVCQNYMGTEAENRVRVPRLQA